MLHVEDKSHKLGLFREVNAQEMVEKGIVLKAMPVRSPKVTVMDAYLKPLKGAKVYAKAMYGLTGVESLAGVTNSAGEVKVPAVYHGGKYIFRIALPGYCPSGATAPPVGGKNWIDSIEIVTEPATKVVNGKVVDSKDKPVPGAKVTTDFGPQAVTDRKGEFTLKQMPSYAVRLNASKGKLHGSNVDAKGNLIRAAEPIITLH